MQSHTSYFISHYIARQRSTNCHYIINSKTSAALAPSPNSDKRSHLFAPVQTILPELKMSAVVRGTRIRMMTAAKRFGLYSALRAHSAMRLRSSLHPRLTVHTMFLRSATDSMCTCFCAVQQTRRTRFCAV